MIFDLGLSYVSFIRCTQWFLTFACGCTVDAVLGHQPEQRAYFDSRVRCSVHAETLPFRAPSYRAYADDYRTCEGCGQLCAPFPDRDSPGCSRCWHDAEKLAEEMAS